MASMINKQINKPLSVFLCSRQYRQNKSKLRQAIPENKIFIESEKSSDILVHYGCNRDLESQ